MQRNASALTRWSYQKLLKPIFFLLDAEYVHDTMIRFGETLGRAGLFRQLLFSLWATADVKLVRKRNGIVFPNPIGLAAGFDYNGRLTSVLPAVGFGFHTIGTVTLHPYKGNQTPRLQRLPHSKALLINKGLKNNGARKIIAQLKKLPLTLPTGISIASTNKLFLNETQQIKDITDCFRLFEKSPLRHAYYELNISCPNTFGGEPFTTPEKLKRLLTALDALKIERPTYVKMPIDQTDKETLALLKVLKKHNVDGVIFGNLTKDKKNPAVSARDRVYWIAQKGNLSGKPTWSRSNHCIALAKKHLPKRMTIIGTGGVFSGKDAKAKMKAGADLIQLITGMIYEGPQLIGEINQTLLKQRR